MPSEFPAPEYAGWMVIGRPALGLALHLASPPTADPLNLYRRMVPRITEALVTYGRYYYGDGPWVGELEYVYPLEAPLAFRNVGGVCVDTAYTSAFFASTALGAMTGVFSDGGHTMALLVLPSKLYGRVEAHASDAQGLPGTGPVSTHHDLDGDGVEDAGVLLANTDPPEYTLKAIDKALRDTGILLLNGDTLMPRLFDELDNPTWGGWLYMYGFTNYVRGLPRWLTPLWYPLFEEKVYSKMLEEMKDKELTAKRLMHASTYFGIGESRAAEAVNTTVRPGNATVPSHRLAVRNTINNMPTVDAGVETPPIIVWRLLEELGGGEGEQSPSETPSVGVNASLVLEPVYRAVEAPGAGQALVFDHYASSVVVNSTNITVATGAWYGDYTWDILVYVNGTRAYTAHQARLPATLVFEHRGILYSIEVALPEPPALNETVNVTGLEPVENVTLPLPDGTLANVTIYRVNMTVKAGNTTIVVYGYVSRLGVDLDVYVYGAPPAEYNATIEGLNATVTLDYQGALHVRIHYQVPEGQNGYPQLLPPNTPIKTAIQPLNLTIQVLVKR